MYIYINKQVMSLLSIKCLIPTLFNLLDISLTFEIHLYFLNNLLDTEVRKDMNSRAIEIIEGLEGGGIFHVICYQELNFSHLSSGRQQNMITNYSLSTKITILVLKKWQCLLTMSKMWKKHWPENLNVLGKDIV